VRRVAALCFVVLLAGCAGPASLPTAVPTQDITVTSALPNGRFEIVVKASYTVGDTVKATLRLVPTSGSLRGPVDAYVQASGFRGTAIVRHLAVAPVTANAGATAEVPVNWDLKDDAGATVQADDYSLVLAVLDDQGRRTAMGASILLR
jgi:hypothetical protein